MTPFLSSKSDTARVSDHRNDACVMINNALQKILRPIGSDWSLASVSNSLIWNASNKGDCFFGDILTIFELFAMIGWSKFHSRPRTVFINLKVVFVKCATVCVFSNLRRY